MEKPNEFGFTPTQKAEVDAAFHRQLGNTIVQWAGVEHQMYNWFWRLSKIPNGDTARLIFYSARSFQGRFDMLKAILTAPSDALFYSSGQIEFIRSALILIHRYVPFRNVIAHGLTVYVENTNTVHMASDGNMLLVGVEWADVPTMKDEALEIPKSVLIRHLKAAYDNWYDLKHILYGVFDPKKAKRPGTPKEGLERLALLPRWAHST